MLIINNKLNNIKKNLIFFFYLYDFLKNICINNFNIIINY